MGARRRCCCCPEIVVDLCDEDIWANFLEDEAIGEWAVSPAEPFVKPCSLQETDGIGRMISKAKLGTKYMIVRGSFLNVQVGDSYSLIVDWGTYGDERRWFEFRYTRTSSNTASLAWYSHHDDVETQLSECVANSSVWPYPQLGTIGHTVDLVACVSLVPDSDPEQVELYGTSQTPGASRLRQWARTGPPPDSDDDKYHAGFATVTPTHEADVIYFSFQPQIKGIPQCQCPRTCECHQDGEIYYPPVKLLLTYQGFYEDGEDDCTSLSGATVTVELYPCGGDVEWIGYADYKAGCFAPETGRQPVRYILRCAGEPFPLPEDWVPGASDWTLVIDEFNLFPNNKHLCTAPYENSSLTLKSTTNSTCHPLVIEFTYGPGENYPDEGMYLGYFPGSPPYSFCPNDCFDCGGSPFVGAEQYHHIRWRILVTEAP